MGDAVVKSTVLWLGKLLATEINYLGEVSGKVETLQSELSSLAAFLLEATKARRHDARVQNALTEGRNLAYDCQDVIETYMLQVAHHGYEQYKGCQLGSALRWVCLLRKAKLVHEIRSQIDDLNKRISILKSNLVSYGVTAQINQVDHQLTREHLPRRVYPHKKEEHVVVGLEKDVDALVERLLNDKDQAVITICGMGGIGKSTLAKELYNHPKLRREEDGFKAFGWASASQQFQSNRVLRTLMYLLVPEDDRARRGKIEEDIRADQAHKALYELMEQVKSLVVVDDIWTSDAWSLLKDAFPLKSETGSRIVLTTRNKDLLSSSLDSHQVHLHLMEGLNDTNSWQLFENITFSGTPCSDSTKERLGREMLRHCKGVPLAIVVLGKILKGKERVEDWKQMHNDICTQILKGGTPNSAYKEVYDVLQVSYDELPLHLKHCFLYLACFPEDSNIGALILYELWAGDGVILKEDPNDELEEEIAERYMNELVSRNMVQAEKRWSDGRVSTCKVHDLMRDVCIDIAKREGFLQTVNCHRRMKLRNINKNADNYLLVNCLPERDKRLRRLAVHMSDHDHYQEEQNSSTLANSTAFILSSSSNMSRAPNLRSLFLFSFEEKSSDELDCKRLMESIFKDCNLLRVLDCRLVYLTGKLPNKLGNLIHLRYLSLRNTRITEVPSSIEKLQWLQTLDLTVDDAVEELTIPNVLWKMKQLRHLLLPGYKSLIRLKNEEEKSNASADVQRYTIRGGGGMLRLDGLSNLQSLVYIDLDRVDLHRDLSNLQSLKRLTGSCETNNNKALHSFLQSCSRIMRIWFRVHAQIINQDPLIFSTCEALDLLRIYAEPRANFQLRQPLKLPKGLVYLFIYNAQLVDDPLPVLEQLPNLQRLNLGMCYGGEKMVCSAAGFPKLTHLIFYGLSSFSQWEVEQGALQKLEYLSIHDCPLSNIPDALPSSVNVNL